MDDIQLYSRVLRNSPEYDKLYARLEEAVRTAGSLYKFCKVHDISYTLAQRALNRESSIGPSLQRALDKGGPLPASATYSTTNPAARRADTRPKLGKERARYYAHKPKRVHTEGEEDDTPATAEQRLMRSPLYMLREIDVKSLPRGLSVHSTPAECALVGIRKINSIYKGVRPKFYVLKGRGDG